MDAPLEAEQYAMGETRITTIMKEKITSTRKQIYRWHKINNETLGLEPIHRPEENVRVKAAEMNDEDETSKEPA